MNEIRALPRNEEEGEGGGLKRRERKNETLTFTSPSSISSPPPLEVVYNWEEKRNKKGDPFFFLFLVFTAK